MSGNNKERDKSARERGIFLEFPRVAPLNIDPASVQSEKPPNPYQHHPHRPRLLPEARSNLR